MVRAVLRKVLSSQCFSVFTGGKKMEIIKKCSTVHTSQRAKTNKVDYIVIHYTAGATSKKGTARATASYFATSNVAASSDFIVDDAEIVQYNPDIQKYNTWAVGGSLYKKTKGGKFYSKCKNGNSISIEMCSTNASKKITFSNDKNYSVSDAVVANTITLVKYLMKVYHVDIKHVIRHYDVTGKICPGVIGWNEASGDVSKWVDFKNRLAEAEVEKLSTTESKEKIKSFTVKVNITNLNIRNKPNMDGKIVGMTGRGVFTIVEEKGDWGLLKSHEQKKDGWIYLGNKNYLTRL